MNNRRTAVQIASLIAAVVVGVLLDRLVLGARTSNPSRSAVAADSTVASPDGRSGGSVAASSPGERVPAQKSSPAKPSDESGNSLDAILAQNDARQRLRHLQTFLDSVPAGGFADALRRIRQITSSNERLPRVAAPRGAMGSDRPGWRVAVCGGESRL
jgi:hypothetical protein